MKKINCYLLTIFTFVLVVSTASCNATAATPITTIAPAATATTPATATAAPIPPGDSEHKLTVNGLERSYVLHVPPGLDNLHPLPVVLAFHGLGSNPSEMQLLTGLNAVADKASFLLVYPEGVGKSWNVGVCCGYAAENKIDDTTYVRQVISDLETIASVDPKRIYAIGFSNGGLLVYQLACEMSDVIAGIAPVAGHMVDSSCQPKQPVSVIHVHGGADTAAPYAGGGELNLPPVEQVITTWVQLDGCDSSPQVEKLQNIITHTSYASCQAGTAVELYVIEPGGHNWPSKYVWPASQVIWDFFAAHPKP
jgi:polyhydroxybutyrate depolymerase